MIEIIKMEQVTKSLTRADLISLMKAHFCELVTPPGWDSTVVVDCTIDGERVELGDIQVTAFMTRKV